MSLTALYPEQHNGAWPDCLLYLVGPFLSMGLSIFRSWLVFWRMPL